jgi:hypothetical protein
VSVWLTLAVRPRRAHWQGPLSSRNPDPDSRFTIAHHLRACRNASSFAWEDNSTLLPTLVPSAEDYDAADYSHWVKVSFSISESRRTIGSEATQGVQHLPCRPPVLRRNQTAWTANSAPMQAPA